LVCFSKQEKKAVDLVISQLHFQRLPQISLGVLSPLSWKGDLVLIWTAVQTWKLLQHWALGGLRRKCGESGLSLLSILLGHNDDNW